MRIAIAQTRPRTGDVSGNVADHVHLVGRAAVHGAGFVAFPELSLTGYEPALAGELATDQDDRRLDALQRVSDVRGIAIAAGVPTRAPGKPRISLVLFQPRQPRSTYSKQHLHADEEPFFVSGPPTPGILGTAPRIGLAICYELSVPAHAETTFRHGAGVYVASVAKTATGVAAAGARLAAVARQFAAPVLMVNCVGTCDGVQCAGGSAIWNRRGERLAQLDDTREGILVLDTDREAAVAVEA